MANLPTEAAARKQFPIATGVLDYFPDALAEVARVSKVGNDQHNGIGSPLHWDRSKSTDEADAAIRHFLERDSKDTDGTYHAAKACWRMLAFLQKKIENEQSIAKLQSVIGMVQGLSANPTVQKHLAERGLQINQSAIDEFTEGGIDAVQK